MKWVTRRRIRVNRTATAWLIRRFIDPIAEFAFVDPDDVAAVQERDGAIGFDAADATYPHKDALGRCSFEALVEEHHAGNAVLRQMALIVRGADFSDQMELTRESAGLEAISHGFPLVTHDDYETLEKASFVYDSLYASVEERLSGVFR